ncbi:MAG: oligosaccharide flippase family protein, partial [Hymenobacteraceae bacterium]|nr:oligosaccharide flippase family protein [Hymenobacteraceae bacterium]
SDLGLTQHTTRRVAAEPGFLPDFFPTLLPLKGGLSVVFLGVMLVVGWLLGYRGTALGWLALIGVSLLLTQYAQFLRGPIQGRQLFGLDAGLSVLEKALLLGLVLALVPTGLLSLGTYVGARVAAAAVTCGVFSVVVARLLGGWVWPRLNPRAARGLLREALPLALITLLYGLNERIDMVMIERLAGPREAGLYAGAYRWTDAAMMYLWTVLPLFFARFALHADDRAAQTQLLSVGQRVAAAPLLLVVAGVLLRGEVLFWQFSGSTPAEVARMTQCLRLLFLNILVHAFFAIYSTLLTSTRLERPVSRLVALSIALNVGLNLAFLPTYGAVAGAANTLFCATVVSGGYVWLVARRAGIVVPWGALSRLALAFGLTCGAWLGLKIMLNNWLIETGLMTIIFAGILLLTGVVRVAELRALRGGEGASATTPT